jgi:hypothetical protein
MEAPVGSRSMIPLRARAFRPRRYYGRDAGTWSGHLPFAHDLIAATRPALFVELGTHRGESYFGFCQSVEENGVPCRCYAVDTWRGDEHAGWYDDTVFAEVNDYNEQHYRDFSHLLRSTFDDALGQFSEGSIGILHIDGLHTYAQVKHDYETWLPKMRPGGIILFHDTAARHGDFGVWRLWEELQRQYPSFEFTHSWGLGIIQIGEAADSHDFLRALFHGSESDRIFVKHYYETEAKALEFDHRVTPAAGSAKPFVQVFVDSSGEFAEKHSAKAELAEDEWRRVVLEFHDGCRTGRIRLDPANCPCVIDLAGVRIRRAIDGAVLIEWTDPEDIRRFECVAELVALPADSGGAARFLSTGADPRLILPRLDHTVADQPLAIEIWIRISTNLTDAVRLLQSTTDGVLQELRDIRVAHEQLAQQFEATQDRLRASEQQEQTLRSELSFLGKQQLIADGECERLTAERDALLERIDECTRRTEREQNLRADLERQIQEYQRMADSERRRQAELVQSWSWKLTAPIRMLTGLTRRRLQ